MKTFFADSLGLPDIDIVRAHRIGARNVGRKTNRTIIVEMSQFKQKGMILRAAKEKRIVNIFINEDYSQRLLMKRQALMPKMYAARREGKLAYISYDKLIVKDKQ